MNNSITSVLAILAVSASATFASDFPTLVSKVPGNANAIMVIDVDAILASRVATTNGWEKRFADGNADRPLYLPPEADKVVVGAQFDVVRGFARNWEVALMGMKEPFSMSLVARAEGGNVDKIDGVNVAWVPSDAYFVEVDPQTLGLMAPADRQALARWANNGRKSVAGQVSQYLMTAGTVVGTGPQAVIAIDTENAIQPHRVQARLQEANIDKSLDVDATAQLISSMQGIVLEMTFTDDVQAVARINFAMPVKLSETAAKGLVLQAMDTLGMSLPGTENWKCSVSINSITLSGELVPESLRRVFSLMELPTTKFSSLKDQPIETPAQDDPATLSQKYFQSIESLLKDLKGRTKSSTSGDSHWVNIYASKIDNLPILHVDADLLTYGEKLSETLHVMSNARRTNNMQGASASNAALSSAGFSNAGVDGYGYRNYNYTSPRASRTNAMVATQEATAAGTSVKLQGWTLIEEATVEIRRTMTQRYNVEF